ncbi:antA/AntB antirepressor family protein [Marinomonas transparens]|uniref:AntA/AntB antirepressor family protein n=1 Tax=Marinomonas transparens TaxID=2795388 RepID=A0A934JSA5_9GAMM|nr:antA/AntB antirepressor family protein [Marinomonas transparens]MBJ7536172.1 antA/AntB antirepressor family protein [Marinomonas transparens]
MATQLIPLYTCLLNERPTDTVSARDLYSFLQLKQDFTHWITSKINKLRFVRGQDFILVDNLIRPTPHIAPTRVQKTKDYFINLDMAYEMSMEENSDLSRQASDYLRTCDTPQNRYLPKPPLAAQLDPSSLEAYQQLNKMARDMSLGSEPTVVPAAKLRHMIRVIRFSQQRTDELRMVLHGVNDSIESLKHHANNHFLDG